MTAVRRQPPCGREGSASGIAAMTHAARKGQWLFAVDVWFRQHHNGDASGSSSKGSQTAAGLFSQPRDQFGGIGVSRQRR